MYSFSDNFTSLSMWDFLLSKVRYQLYVLRKYIPSTAAPSINYNNEDRFDEYNIHTMVVIVIMRDCIVQFIANFLLHNFTHFRLLQNGKNGLQSSVMLCAFLTNENKNKWKSYNSFSPLQVWQEKCWTELVVDVFNGTGDKKNDDTKTTFTLPSFSISFFFWRVYCRPRFLFTKQTDLDF